MVSKDGELRFRAFARQSVRFQENFSIGLEFEPEDGSEGVILLRCNGPHGVYNRSSDVAPPHFQPHIHTATAAALEAGEKAESHAEVTDEYAVLKEAMRYFLGRVSLDANDQARWFGDELRTSQYDLEFGS